MSIKTQILIFRILAVFLWVASAVLGGVLWFAREHADLYMLLYMILLVLGIIFGIFLWNIHMRLTGFYYKGVWCPVAYSWKHRSYYGMALGEYFESPDETEIKQLLMGVVNERSESDL